MRTGELVRREGGQARGHPDPEPVPMAVVWSSATRTAWGAGERIVVGDSAAP